jgi:hypothetical protein
MRTRLDRASFHIVTAARVLSLELEQWQARPVGHISDQAGHTVSFDGWVAFVAALERLCGSEEDWSLGGFGRPEAGA